MSLPILVCNKKTGRLYINPAKRFVKPFWLQTDPVKVTVTANGTSDPVPMTIDQTGHVELFYALYQSTGKFLVEIFDPGRASKLMNRPIHIDTIAGTALRPFIFPETYFLNVGKGTRQLTVTFTDISGSSNDIRFALHGRKFIHPEAPRDIYDKFEKYFQKKERTNLYFMTTEEAISALVAAATKETEFRVPADSYFEILKLTAVDVSARTYEVQLQEQASGRYLHSRSSDASITDAIYGTSAFGTAQYPFILAESYLVEKDSRILVALKNLGGAAGSFYLTMIGRRLKYLDEGR